jgi:hypothetical protein
METKNLYNLLVIIQECKVLMTIYKIYKYSLHFLLKINDDIENSPYALYTHDTSGFQSQSSLDIFLLDIKYNGITNCISICNLAGS